jgi:hypothetical protein
VTVKAFSSDKAPVLFACEVSGIILVKNLIYHLVERVIICLNGGGHIILNYKKISREYSFSRGGSNTETNASPLINHPNCKGSDFFVLLDALPFSHPNGWKEALFSTLLVVVGRRKSFQTI